MLMCDIFRLRFACTNWSKDSPLPKEQVEKVSCTDMTLFRLNQGPHRKTRAD